MDADKRLAHSIKLRCCVDAPGDVEVGAQGDPNGWEEFLALFRSFGRA